MPDTTWGWLAGSVPSAPANATPPRTAGPHPPSVHLEENTDRPPGVCTVVVLRVLFQYAGSIDSQPRSQS
jgi:hypothetical protein